MAIVTQHKKGKKYSGGGIEKKKKKIEKEKKIIEKKKKSKKKVSTERQNRADNGGLDLINLEARRAISPKNIRHFR